MSAAEWEGFDIEPGALNSFATENGAGLETVVRINELRGEYRAVADALQRNAAERETLLAEERALIATMFGDRYGRFPPLSPAAQALRDEAMAKARAASAAARAEARSGRA